MPERRRRPETAEPGTGLRPASRPAPISSSGISSRAGPTGCRSCRRPREASTPWSRRSAATPSWSVPGAAAARQSDARGAGDQSRDGRVQAGIRAGRARRAAGVDTAGLQPQRRAGDDAHGRAAARRERPRGAPIGMNGGVNAFGSGNRANATIGRAIRLVLLNVGGGWPGDLDKSTLGHPGKYTYAVAENEAGQPVGALSCREGVSRRRFDRVRDRRRAAAQRHEPCRRRPRGHPRQHLLVDEHDRQQQRGVVRPLRRRDRPRARRTIAGKGWTRHDVRSYLHMNAWNLFRELAFDHRYGRIYNRNLPRWYKRDPTRASRSCRAPTTSTCS